MVEKYARRFVYVRDNDLEEIVNEKDVTGYSGGHVDQITVELRRKYPGERFSIGDSHDDVLELDEDDGPQGACKV